MKWVSVNCKACIHTGLCRFEPLLDEVRKEIDNVKAPDQITGTLVCQVFRKSRSKEKES